VPIERYGQALEIIVKPPSECDVTDFVALARYRKLRATAFQLLRGDEEHSIWEQMVTLFWRDASYRLFNEARRTASDERPNAAISGLLGEFLDAAYILFEVTAISRLTDPPSSEPERGLVSLPTILQLLRDNRELITREMFVAFDGSPYDPTPPMTTERFTEVRWVAREPWDDSEQRHLLFDRLSRRSPDRRKRSDLVHSKVLTMLERKLAIPTIRSIRSHRNKVISHAADRASRTGLTPLGLSMASIDEAHLALLQVTETLATALTGEILIGGPVPQPQFDFLEKIDLPFAFRDDLGELEAYFFSHLRVREDWSRDAVSTVLGR
jgi:hypothetical protein